MKDHLINCPLCSNEIPFDTSQCPYCGALLAPGPTRTAPILKGVVCLKCGEKNYSYDECSFCGHPFTITCPECGGELKLKDQSCPNCGLSLRKFGPTRRRVEKSKKKKTISENRWTFIAPIGIALLVVLIAVIYTICSSGEEAPPGEAPVKAGKAKAVDTNADGAPDRWDVYGETGKVVERRFDANGDGLVERIEFYGDNELIELARIDEDGDEIYELVQVYDLKGNLSLAYFYLGSDTQQPSRIERFNVHGHRIERWVDTDGDYDFDRYFRYDARERLVMEGSDTNQSGYLDLFLVYHGNKQIFQRQYDTDGDGCIERTETLNAEGIRIILEEDTDADGLIDKRTCFFLNGNTRQVQIDSDGDGVFNILKTYTEEGRYARTGTDVDGDGFVDQWK